MEKRALRELYEKYGESVMFDPRKLRAHLLDLRLPKKNVHLLVDISKIDYFRQFTVDIISGTGAREKLIYSVNNEYAFDRDAVEFGVDCWVYAIIGNTGGDIWSEDKAALVAAALRELMKE